MNERTEMEKHKAALKRIEEKLGTYTITPPLSPRADSAPAEPHWGPPAMSPPQLERAQTISNLCPKRTSLPQRPSRSLRPPASKPTVAAKLYSFTHSRQDLLDAIEQENLALVQQLVHDYGRDVNHASIDRNGETPLTLAAALGHTDIVRWLVDNGADLERRNHHGISPLAAAARGGKHCVVQLLLGYGANTEAKEKVYQATALQLAFEKGAVAVECIRLLLEKGADANATDSSGRSLEYYLEKIPAGGIRQQIIYMLKDYGVSLPRRSQCQATPPPQYDAAGYRCAPGSPPPSVDYGYTSAPFWRRFSWPGHSQPQSPVARYQGHYWGSISHPVPAGYGLSNAATTSW